MAKDDLNLDEELNDNLDFLEDNELNLNQSNGYLSSNQSSNSNKTKLITIGIIIGIIVLTVSMQVKKKLHHAKKFIPAPIEQPSPATNNHILSKPHQEHFADHPHQTTNTPETTHAKEQPTISNNNNLTWQDLKKSVEETTTAQPDTTTHNPSSHTNFEIPIPVKGFEHTTTTTQITQTLPNNTHNNSETQESINELKTTIENITNDLTANVNQIKELQNNLKEISRSIGNVNSNINNVDSKILNLTNTVDSLSMNIKKYTQEEDLDLTAHVKPSEPDLFSNTPEYLVHAVIPGRAWLKSSSGQIITVTEGDSLGDYGKIALIDTANNLVRTSSGVVFR